jgi:hypothetical protein
MASLDATASLTVDQPAAFRPAEPAAIGPQLPQAFRGAQPATHANDDAYAVVERLYRDQCTTLHRVARQHVGALRRLTALRRANEELQNCFAGLERVLPQDARGMTQVFADEPPLAATKLKLGWSSGGLAQTLPVSSTGLSAVELLLGDIRASDHGKLHVHLISLENHAVLDRWTLPLDEVASGWTMFCLTRPLVGPTRTLELRLDVECDADVNVGVTLGGGRTIEPFRARDPAGGKIAAQHGLAMRVWCGDSETAFARHPQVILADAREAAGTGQVEVPLSPTLMARVEHATAQTVRFDFEPVTHIPYRVAVGVHPAPHGVTLARLDLPADTVVFAARAELQVGSDKANPVEFAMVLATDLDRAMALLEDPEKAEPIEAVSPWHRAAFGEAPVIEASPAQPTTRELKLFLATRMPTGTTHHFAWARFRDLRLRVIG